MLRIPSALIFFNFIGTLGGTCWETCILSSRAFIQRNYRSEILFRPHRPPMIPGLMLQPFRLLFAGPLKNPFQLFRGDSHFPICKSGLVCSHPSLTASAINTFSRLSVTCVENRAPSANMCLIGCSQKSCFLHAFTASVRVLFALLISAGSVLRPMSRLDQKKTERVGSSRTLFIDRLTTYPQYFYLRRRLSLERLVPCKALA